ncbi:DUF6314 family protein [Arthrobacter sp. UYCu712]|uniref:DUF6314 family protein n=1 Tax=Arthrobacter sp. UYCu712 TaxID=3156340 RepID=UPI00339229A1
MNSPAPAAAAELDLRGYLLGAWSLTRTLLDRATGTRGTFTGVVRFTPLTDDGGLHFREEGTLVWTSFTGKPFTGPASRDYLLRPTGTLDALDMFFPDGRPFHRMGFGQQSSHDEHWCDPDTYRVTYTLVGPAEFHYRWDVTGPMKDQLIESVLRRTEGPPV